MDEYQQLAYIYESLNPKAEVYKQEDFFKTLITKYNPKTVLDCACGTGWHLALLDDLGLKASGSDISEDMLKFATDNLEGRAIELKQSDYRNLKQVWNTNFDMVVCMTTSLPYMLTVDDTADALNSMYNRLNKGGVLVIDNGMTDAFFKEKPQFMPARVNEDNAFYFFFEYPSEDIVKFNILYVQKTKDGFEHKFMPTTYQAMTKEKLEKAFAKTWFSKVEYYGNHRLDQYSVESSKRLVAVAVR